MSLPKELQNRIQALSNSNLNLWQAITSKWPASNAAPVSSDIFLSLVVEVKRQRAELHRLTEIAESVDPLVIRLGEVTTKLERANALLREAIGWNWLDEDSPIQAGVNTDSPSCLDELYLRMQSHVQGAGYEA